MPPNKRPGASIFGQDDTDDADARKKARMAKLGAWKANKAVEEATRTKQAQVAKQAGPGSAPSGAGNDDNDGNNDGELDPLDAFMSSEVLPEVKRRQEEEMRTELEERGRLEADLKAGRVPKAIRDLLADDSADAGAGTASDAEMVMQIPGKMLKRLMGPGGETIRHITMTSGCKIKVAKGAQAMKLGFGATIQDRVNAHLADSEVVTLELRGSKNRCEQARELVLEAIDNKTERERRRALAKEKREIEGEYQGPYIQAAARERLRGTGAVPGRQQGGDQRGVQEAGDAMAPRQEPRRRGEGRRDVFVDRQGV